MSLAEGVQGTIVYKAYAAGAITANTEDNAPGTSGSQTLRRVSSTLNLAKATYTSAEIRADRQIVDYRHGARQVQGDIAGELSPATYFDFFEAVHRDTRSAGVTLTEADLTSVAASASGSTFTFAGGDPVSEGLRAGDVMRFSSMAVAANNDRNFTIVSFSGTSNRVVHVIPAPTDQTADTGFSLARPGYATEVPSSGHISRKFGIEIAHQDLDISRLFTECRLTKYALSLPATGLGTVTFSVMGRGMRTLSGGTSPYFVSPATETTTGIVASVNGALLLNGVSVGVVTGVTLTMDMPAEAASVVGQNFGAEIFLGRNNLTGQITAYLEDTTFIDGFLDETEFELLLQLDTTSGEATPTITLYLPRIKLGGADVALTGEAGQVITANFQALKYVGSTPGKPTTTIRIVDTEVA
jgi:hypothetical protein